MQRTVSVPALQPLTYQGRSYVRGDRIEMRPIHALAYSRKGLVSLTRGKSVEPTMGVNQPKTPEKRPNTPILEAQAEDEQPKPRRGRRYRRQDMEAEAPIDEMHEHASRAVLNKMRGSEE